MPKFKIVFGLGPNIDKEIIEAESFDEASAEAYLAAMELFEREATYYAEEVDEDDNA